MTAFLFIPATAEPMAACGTMPTRRVDFSNIAGLFGEPEDVPASRRPSGTAAKVLASVLILVCALGDTLLVARPDALIRCFASLHQTVGGLSRPASL